jgi:3-hydroxyacyl-[acyl-carrier-protein] dehydratase
MSAPKAPFGRQQVEAILPHRDPFLFVDQVLELLPGDRVVGLVRARPRAAGPASEPACFPSSILAEAMAQVGAILVLHPEENRGRTIFFRAIDRARFRRVVPPDATLRVEARVRRLRGRLGSLEVRAYLGDSLAASGIMAFALSE